MKGQGDEEARKLGRKGNDREVKGRQPRGRPRKQWGDTF